MPLCPRRARPPDLAFYGRPAGRLRSALGGFGPLRWTPWAVCVLALALSACGTRQGSRAPSAAPWKALAPVAIDEPPDRLTRLRLRRLDDDPAECLAVLALAGVAAEPVPDREVGGGCGWTHAVQVERSEFAARPSFLLTCRATVSLLLWQRHVVAPAALKHYGEPVAGFEHMGSYACRNVNGSAFGERSRHARADAIDIAAFRLRSGRRVSVLRGWQGEPADAAFLREIHAGACGLFDVVLGPDSNAAHADHLHLDRGTGSSYCR